MAARAAARLGQHAPQAARGATWPVATDSMAAQRLPFGGAYRWRDGDRLVCAWEVGPER
jgi:hypothetical protein